MVDLADAGWQLLLGLLLEKSAMFNWTGLFVPVWCEFDDDDDDASEEDEADEVDGVFFNSFFFRLFALDFLILLFLFVLLPIINSDSLLSNKES